jgi:rod shape-determining protein MreC
VTASAGSLTQTALVRPFVDFTALGVVGVVVQVPAHNPRVSILPRPAPTVTVTTTPHPATSSTLAPYSNSPSPGTTGPPVSPPASPSAGG